MYYHILVTEIWGFGEVGIAPDWQSGGQGFESPKLHGLKMAILSRYSLFLYKNKNQYLKVPPMGINK